MTRKSLALIVLALVLLTVGGSTAASTAWAGGGATALIKDASDGAVDGTYSAAVVRSALAIVRSDPAYTMYSDIEGVLVDYLASISGSGGGSTPKPAKTSTPTPSATATSDGKATATPKASPHPKRSPRASKSPTAQAHPAPQARRLLRRPAPPHSTRLRLASPPFRGSSRCRSSWSSWWA